MGTLRDDFYTVQTVYSIPPALNIPMTENFLHCYVFKTLL